MCFHESIQKNPPRSMKGKFARFARKINAITRMSLFDNQKDSIRLKMVRQRYKAALRENQILKEYIDEIYRQAGQQETIIH